MAKGKMKEKECCGSGCCGFSMCGTCVMVSGLILVIGGAALAVAETGYMSVMQADLLGGVAVALFGLGLIVHAAKLCPMCK